jgi:prophage regulatory protein
MIGTTASGGPKRSLINLQAVVERTGLSKSVIYVRMAAGTFPLAVSLGAATVRWVDTEIDKWIDDQIKARDASVE